MGNEPNDVSRQWYPNGEPSPPSTSHRVKIISLILTITILGLVLAGLAIVFDLPVLDKGFLLIGPLLGGMLGSYLRDRGAARRAAEGLYTVQARFAPDGVHFGRWRGGYALSMPGIILCRPYRTEQDTEVRVNDIERPRSVSKVTEYLTYGTPTSIMKVDTEGGAVELRGRPEHLPALATGAAH